MDGIPARAAVQAVTIDPPSLVRRSVDPIVHTEITPRRQPSRNDFSRNEKSHPKR
jgi:hypothetical protein